METSIEDDFNKYIGGVDHGGIEPLTEDESFTDLTEPIKPMNDGVQRVILNLEKQLLSYQNNPKENAQKIRTLEQLLQNMKTRYGYVKVHNN